MMLRYDKRIPDLGLAVQPGYPRIIAIDQLYDVTQSSLESQDLMSDNLNFCVSVSRVGCWMKKSFCSKNAHLENEPYALSM